MNKIFKSVISLILAVVICFGIGAMSYASTDKTEASPLRFGEDGKFRIMHVTDTHLNAGNIDISSWLIADACDRENPDLIALTGDIAMTGDEEEILMCIDKLMTVFNDRNIPVAVTFGNHDSEKGVFTREALMEIYNTYPCSISIDDGEDLSGCGTYNIPILSSSDDTVKFNVWMFDSGDYDSEGHYANVLEDQVEWYRNKSEQLERENGEKINSLVFQHIVVPEIYEALQKRDVYFPGCVKHMYNSKAYYTFDKNNENFGQLTETPCCGYYNHGQFDAFVERGDVLGIFTGHDHTNTFDIKYKDIRLTNSASTRFDPTKAIFSTQYGYRMIEIDENDTSDYVSKAVHWYDYFSLDDLKNIKANESKEIYKYALKIDILGMIQKSVLYFEFFIVNMFTGTKMNYN